MARSASSLVVTAGGALAVLTAAAPVLTDAGVLPAASSGEFTGTLLTVTATASFSVVALAAARSRDVGRWLPLVLAQFAFAAAQVHLLVAQVRDLAYPFPSGADVAFVVGNLLLFWAVLRLVPGPRRGLGGAEILDGLVVTVSVGILFVVFAVLPAAGAGGPLLARLVSVTYPVLDIAAVHLLARTAGWPGRPPAAFWWLAAALLSSVAADVAYTVLQAGGVSEPTPWIRALWTGYYTFIAAAVVSTSAPRLGRRPVLVGPGAVHLRMPILAVAAVLPAAAVVVGQVSAGPDHVVPLTAGSVVVLLLVLARVWTLLTLVRDQASVVARLADTDPLTGLANRRGWDAEVVRAFGAARSTGDPVTVAIVDVDHFKAYNDTHGHDGGDDLLRVAAQAWSRGLPGAFVARWGGEEFTVLFPGVDAAGTRSSTARAPAEAPPATLARADKALYRAKTGGRDRSEVATDTDRPVVGSCARPTGTGVHPLGAVG